jgi:hypothetical protein
VRTAVPGDGAAWRGVLAAARGPPAVPSGAGVHASARIWALGRAPHGAGTPEATAWVAARLARLRRGEAAPRAAAWATRPCRGEAATSCDEPVTSFANRAGRLASDRDREPGWDIGSGMVASACTPVIAAREPGPGTRWSAAGAPTVAAVRLLPLNDAWDDFDLAA